MNFSYSSAQSDPSASFGSNSWNVHAYNSATYTNNFNLFDFSDYRGMYTETGLNFSSSDQWSTISNPSNAPDYSGLSVTNELHLVSYKRAGFPCGYYSIDIAGTGSLAGHDDAARLIIDGTVVWSNTGCCQQRLEVWEGFLGPSSEVDFTWADNTGNSYGRVRFNAVNPIEVMEDISICQGSSTTLSASGAPNYDWSSNTTYLSAPLDQSSVTLAPPLGAPNTVQTYTVSTTDATTGCVVSNSIDVTISSAPPVINLSTTSGSYCSSGQVDVTASGALSYTWSPTSDVTINDASGSDVSLSPSSTTVYTVTGTNNCTTTNETVTVTVTIPPGDPTQFGNNVWNVYAYSGEFFDEYRGYYVHNTLDFDTRSVWSNNGNPGQAPGYSGCSVPNDFHSFSYKRRGFDCGYYQLDIPNHDDRVEVYIDGDLVFFQNSWFNNTYKTDVWRGYLGSDTEVEYRINERSGGSNGGLAFIYLHGPDHAANESVWNGDDDTDWFNANNWCNSVPTPSIDAYIPNNVLNDPLINNNGAECNNLFIQENALLDVGGFSLDIYGGIAKEGALNTSSSTINVLGNSTVELSSTNNQLVFYNLNINNSSATGILLNGLVNDRIVIQNSLTFNDGIIQTGPTNLVEIEDDCVVSGMNNNSHVHGRVRKLGDDAFDFPIGTGTIYRPISISAPTDINDYFTAEYFDSDPNSSGFLSSSKEATIDSISQCEYWILDRNGSSDVSVTLSFSPYGGSFCSGVTDPSSLKVVRWNGSSWIDHGNGGFTGTTTGTVTSAGPITSFSPFTLGTSDPIANPLPVELLYFTVQPVEDNKVSIEWATATETNNDFFTIERSRNGEDWIIVDEVPGNGNSSQVIYYDHMDTAPYLGLSYYRLKQTDFDGEYEYFPIESVDLSASITGVSIYPNPVKSKLYISAPQGESFSTKIIDSFGKEVHSSKDLISINLNEYANGVYTVIISIEGRQPKLFKLIKL